MAKKILIIDDDPVIVKYLEAVFSDNGYETCSAGSTSEGLEVVRKEKPDLITLDIQMPDLDGFEVIEQIPGQQMPVIVFVTAYDRYALDAFKVHALDYLLKPFDPAVLREKLGKYCRPKQLY